MRESNRLSAIAVQRLKTPGRYGDGAGLWLQVSQSGSKAWLLRYMLNGKARHMGLGPVADVSLAEARDLARKYRKTCLAGSDPIEARLAERRGALAEAAKGMTFSECAERLMASLQAGWRNAKHRQQWKSTLVSYAYPVFGDLPVDAIDTGLVLKAIEPIWTTKPETAGRVRGRIEAVLDWATARGYRQGDNPARWRGHVDKLLPARSKVARVEHHAALPYPEVPVFIRDLRGREGVAARALEFAILTAARTGEVIGSIWAEFDLNKRLWTIPSERMKAGRPHRVPLSSRALAILEDLPVEGEFVFCGSKKSKPLSDMSLLATMRRMGRGDLTTHGFRSSFRDWAAETTAFPRDLCEMALAHTVGDKVEAAYRRGDLFEKRRELAEAWGTYCGTMS